MKSESDKLRVQAVTELEKIIDMGITARVIERLAGIGHRTIYRCQFNGTGLWVPSFKDCGRILEICQVVAVIKNDWADIVKSWIRKYHRATMVALFKPTYLRILESKKLDREEKVEILTRMTFRDWARVGKERVKV